MGLFVLHAVGDGMRSPTAQMNAREGKINPPVEYRLWMRGRLHCDFLGDPSLAWLSKSRDGETFGRTPLR